MPAPQNPFKAALQRGEMQYGCWGAFAHPYATELMASTGFDWLVIDGEHAPNDLPTITAQLQALHGYTTHPVVRLPMGEDWAIKQVLDAGAQTLLIPMVESAGQARALVRAMRYPPAGIRGSGAMIARATMFAGVENYVATADAQMCLLVQVESHKGLEALDDILAVDGVDGVFIGPADLAADMGFGADSRMHSATLLSISSDLPIVIEIVDTKENIDRLMPFLDEHLEEGIVTMEAVHVHKYRRR